MKNSLVVLLVSAILVGHSSAATVSTCKENEFEEFHPWSAGDLSRDDCQKGNTGEPGTCAPEYVCRAGGQGTIVLTRPSSFCYDQTGDVSHKCCVIKKTCKAESPLSNTSLPAADGVCMLPTYCTSGISAPSEQCSGDGLSCCVEQDPASVQTVNCSEVYSTLERRISLVQYKLDTLSISQQRLTNFLPYAMAPYEALKNRCAPLGDCAKSTYVAFFYHLLKDITVVSPKAVVDEIFNTVPQSTAKKLTEALKPHGGQLTPQAFGEMLGIMWDPEDELHLAQYNNGTCSDWIQLANAVRGPNHSWKCDDRWAALLIENSCRPSNASNLNDCANGEGICYLTDEAHGVCAGAGLSELSSSRDECQSKYGTNAFCCQKAQLLSSSKMSYQYNAYENITVAIDSSVPENADLLKNIVTYFTEASQLLYDATDNRAFFGSIRVILPSAWNPSYATGQRISGTSEDAQFVIESDLTYSSTGVLPFHSFMQTLQFGYCGSHGMGTTMTPRDLTGNIAALNIVKHFARNEYGVFTEFPRNEREMAPLDPLKDPIPRCVKDDAATIIIGCDDNLDITIGANHTASGSIEWIPDRANYHNVKHFTRFCDSRECAPHVHHNEMIMNTHNTICNKKPTLDVILENRLFSGVDGAVPRQGLDTTPTFSFLHPDFGHQEVTATPSQPKTTAEWHQDITAGEMPTIVQPSTTTKTTTMATTKPPYSGVITNIMLVLDESGSMSSYNKMENLKAASTHFIDLTNPDISTGIVSFDSYAYQLSPIYAGNSVGKDALKSAVSTLTPGGGTDITDGLNEALKMLENTNRKGGDIMLMTDGIDGHDYISATIDRIRNQGATVHTVAISSSADKRLADLANMTGGESFTISDSDDIVDFLTQMQALISQVESTDEHVTLQNTIVPVESGKESEVPIYLDQGLGSQNLISVMYNTYSSMQGWMVPPADAKDTTEIACVDEPDYNQLKCEMNFKPEVGEWTLRMLPGGSGSGSVAVSATSTVDETEDSTFSIDGYIAKPKIEATTTYYKWQSPSELDKSQAIAVKLSYGKLAVLGAKVKATIKHEDGTQWEEMLSDNGEALDEGQGADLYANDGIYTGLFNKLLNVGRYSVSIEAVGNSRDTFYTSGVLVGVPMSAKYLSQTSEFRIYVTFTRIMSIGMFEVVDNDNPTKVQYIFDPTINDTVALTPSRSTLKSPGRVSKLSVLQSSVVGDKIHMVLGWNSVGRIGMVSGSPSFYMVHVSTHVFDVQGRGDEFETPIHISGRSVDHIKVDADEKITPGTPVIHKFSLPLSNWKGAESIFVSVTAHNVDRNFNEVGGAHSNIATAAVKLDEGVCYSDGSGDCRS